MGLYLKSPGVTHIQQDGEKRKSAGRKGIAKAYLVAKKGERAREGPGQGPEWRWRKQKKNKKAIPRNKHKKGKKKTRNHKQENSKSEKRADNEGA